MSLNAFTQSFTDLAKPTLFEVAIAGLDGSLEFMCKAAQIPPSQIGIMEVPYQGRKLKRAGDRTYPEWTITVMNDVKYTIHEELMLWHDTISMPEGNVGLPPSAYLRAGSIISLDVQKNPIAEYEFVSLWPTEISQIEQGFEMSDTYEEYTVTFAYDFYTRKRFVK